MDMGMGMDMDMGMGMDMDMGMGMGGGSLVGAWGGTRQAAADRVAVGAAQLQIELEQYARVVRRVGEHRAVAHQLGRLDTLQRDATLRLRPPLERGVEAATR
eukprot:4565262-Prymnesium_polylepis.1